MPLPIAHSLIGASVVAAANPGRPINTYWKQLLAGALLATTPDLDYLPTWIFGADSDWHRGFSHSILFAAIVGLLAYVIGKTYVRTAVVLGVAVATHGLVDAAVSMSAKGGVELLWPITHRFTFGLMEYPDTLDFFYDDPTDTLSIKGVYALFTTSWHELLVCGLLFLLVLGVNRLIRARRRVK